LELFKEAIQANRRQLVAAIHVDDRLWSELKTREILTEQQLTECQDYVCYRVFIVSAQLCNVVKL